MRAVAAGGIYVSVLFVCGFVLGPIRVLLLEPYVGSLIAVLIEAPFLLLAMVLVVPRAARWVELPHDALQHVAMGLVAAAWLLVFETMTAWLMRGTPPAALLAESTTPAGLLGLALVAVFALMPLVLLSRQQPRPPQS